MTFASRATHFARLFGPATQSFATTSNIGLFITSCLGAGIKARGCCLTTWFGLWFRRCNIYQL